MIEWERKYWSFIPPTWIGLDAIEDLGSMLNKKGFRKPLVVTGPIVVKTEGFARAQASLKKAGIIPVVFSECMADSPVKVVEACARAAKENKCDCVVGIGGGSPMDTAKLASVLVTNNQDIHEFIGRDNVKKPGLYKVLIPTTAGTGSEWSHPAVLTDDRDGFKKPVFSDYTGADLAIIDPSLSLDLPPKITADTGFDALTHCIEAYGTWKSNVISDMFAERGIELVARSIRKAFAKGNKHLDARYDLCLAAAFGMAAHTSTCAGIAHSMNYPIAAKTHVSHGTALGLILPHVMEFNLVACADKYARIAQLMGEHTTGRSVIESARLAVTAVRQMTKDLNIPQSTSEVGFTEDDIPVAIEFLYENQLYGMENNPRNPTREDFIAIYTAAL